MLKVFAFRNVTWKPIDNECLLRQLYKIRVLETKLISTEKFLVGAYGHGSPLSLLHRRVSVLVPTANARHMQGPTKTSHGKRGKECEKNSHTLFK